LLFYLFSYLTILILFIAFRFSLLSDVLLVPNIKSMYYVVLLLRFFSHEILNIDRDEGFMSGLNHSLLMIPIISAASCKGMGESQQVDNLLLEWMAALRLQRHTETSLKVSRFPQFLTSKQCIHSLTCSCSCRRRFSQSCAGERTEKPFSLRPQRCRVSHLVALSKLWRII
jgi:hypothetical protein